MPHLPSALFWCSFWCKKSIRVGASYAVLALQVPINWCLYPHFSTLCTNGPIQKSVIRAHFSYPFIVVIKNTSWLFQINAVLEDNLRFMFIASRYPYIWSSYDILQRSSCWYTKWHFEDRSTNLLVLLPSFCESSTNAATKYIYIAWIRFLEQDPSVTGKGTKKAGI